MNIISAKITTLGQVVSRPTSRCAGRASLKDFTLVLTVPTNDFISLMDKFIDHALGSERQQFLEKLLFTDDVLSNPTVQTFFLQGFSSTLASWRGLPSRLSAYMRLADEEHGAHIIIKAEGDFNA